MEILPANHFFSGVIESVCFRGSHFKDLLNIILMSIHGECVHKLKQFGVGKFQARQLRFLNGLNQSFDIS